MEGKTIAVTLLLLGLVLGQIQVEATRVCCPSNTAKNLFNACRLAGAPQESCALLAGCRIIPGTKCPPLFPSITLENTGNAVGEYCKLGCRFSVCGAMTTLQDYGEIVNAALETCNNACAAVCTKSSIAAVETA